MLIELRRPLKSIALAAIILGVCTPALAEIRFEPYAGASGAFSRLTPEPGDSGLDVSDTNSFGFSLVLGADIANRWAFEVGFADLGEATLSGPTGDSEISYNAFGLSALFHLFGNSSDIANRDGIWTYLRLGLNQISNDSDLALEEADNSAIWAGIGFEWSFTSNLSFRGELASFDGDAQALTAGVVYRPFSQNVRARTPIPRPQRQPQPTQRPAPVLQPPAETTEPPRRIPIPSTNTPSIVPNVGLVGCESPVGNEPVGADGCALITGIRRNLQFVGNSSQLTPSAASAITSLAGTLRSAPTVRIEIRAHAEVPGGQNAAQDLSRQRAVSVARALVGAGIAVERLGARAFGNTEPVVASGSAAGELLPNRIEIVVQP